MGFLWWLGRGGVGDSGGMERWDKMMESWFLGLDGMMGMGRRGGEGGGEDEVGWVYLGGGMGGDGMGDEMK